MKKLVGTKHMKNIRGKKKPIVSRKKHEGSKKDTFEENERQTKAFL